MSEMCFYYFFRHEFPALLAKKMPRLLLFLLGLFVYVFSIPVPNLIKKNTHIPLFGHAQKMPIWWPGVGQLVGFLVCSSVGWIFVGKFDYIFF
jgi:hypothetical protein